MFHPIGFFRLASLGVVFVAAALFIGCATSDHAAADEHQIFNESVPGRNLLRIGLGEAATEDKRVLLLFGANWCPYCRALHGLLENDDSLRAMVEQHYVVVPIDVGTSARNRNTDLVDRYRAPIYTDGLPALVITDANGERLFPNDSNPWSAQDPITTERVRAFLEKGRQ